MVDKKIKNKKPSSCVDIFLKQYLSKQYISKEKKKKSKRKFFDNLSSIASKIVLCAPSLLALSLNRKHFPLK